LYPSLDTLSATSARVSPGGEAKSNRTPIIPSPVKKSCYIEHRKTPSVNEDCWREKKIISRACAYHFKEMHYEAPLKSTCLFKIPLYAGYALCYSG
jgi:hypothetical protein